MPLERSRGQGAEPRQPWRVGAQKKAGDCQFRPSVTGIPKVCVRRAAPMVQPDAEAAQRRARAFRSGAQRGRRTRRMLKQPGYKAEQVIFMNRKSE